MARGGYRPGAGRPKGAKTAGKSLETGIPADIAGAAVWAGMLPLDYMLTVMRNPEADQARRDRMAMAAAPFCHARVADNRVGKKDVQAADAKNAGHDSEWSSDLEYDDARPN